MVGSGAVSDEAIETAAEHVYEMLAVRPDLSEALANAPIRVAVIGASERITDLPDFTDLYALYPGTDWRGRGRSFPGTIEIPTAAGAEENSLCCIGRPFRRMRPYSYATLPERCSGSLWPTPRGGAALHRAGLQSGDRRGPLEGHPGRNEHRAVLGRDQPGVFRRQRVPRRG